MTALAAPVWTTGGLEAVATGGSGEEPETRGSGEVERQLAAALTQVVLVPAAGSSSLVVVVQHLMSLREAQGVQESGLLGSGSVRRRSARQGL